MPQPTIKLYRGSQTASLPNTITNGAVYILEESNNRGKIYADFDNKRIEISSEESDIFIKTTQQWRTWQAANPNTFSQSGKIYVFSDARSTTVTNSQGQTETIDVPGIKIGDGQTFVVDLPFATVTAEQVNFWNNKVNCYLGGSVLSENLTVPGDNETLVFTRLY